MTVYTGDREEYQTFVSPECVEAVRDYLASRERVGERLGPDSLLFRDKFDYQGDRRQKKLSPSEPHPTTEHNLRTTISPTEHHLPDRAQPSDHHFLHG